MKTKTLENGVTLEVGKKYIGEDWGNSEYIIIKYFANEFFVYETDTGLESTCSYSYAFNNWNLQPYQEPKKMVKLYNYAYFVGDKWLQTQEFFRDNKDYVKRCIYVDNFIRLDHTIIEVEDYKID